MPDHAPPDGAPHGREDVHVRKARRLHDLEHERTDFRIVAAVGLALVAVAAGAGWFALAAVQRGSLDLDEGPSLVHAAEEPVFFYGSVAAVAALGVACAVLGVRMLLHARREVRRTGRLQERLRQVGRGRR